jgi:hypothetical protein
MVGIEIFRNETRSAPITVEPLVYCTRDELRERNWDAVLRLRELEDSGELGVAAALPVAGKPAAQVEAVRDQYEQQAEANVDGRRKHRARQAELVPVEDEELRADAEKKVRRLGVRERVVDVSQGIAATMIAQQSSDARDRSRVSGKAGSGRSGSRSSRGLMHHRPEAEHVSATTGAVSRSLPYRSSAQVGSRVIA